MDYREITKEEATAALRAHAWQEHPTLWVARFVDERVSGPEWVVYGPFDDRDAAVAHARTLSTDPDKGAVVSELRPPGGHRQRIHSMLGFVGADHDLEDALRKVESSTACGWGDSAFLHDLLVETPEGRMYAYAVPRPERARTGGDAGV